MVRMVERKVRSRAKQLYESRGQTDGQELQDWFQAESEVLESNVLARLYSRLQTRDQRAQTDETGSDGPQETSAYETTA